MAIQLTLEQAAQFLQAAQDVLILTHKSPDGTRWAAVLACCTH